MGGKKITLCFLAVIGITALNIQNCSSPAETSLSGVENSSSSGTKASIDASSSSLGTQPPSGASSSSLETEVSSGASSSSFETEVSSGAGSSSSETGVSSGAGSSSSETGVSSGASSSSLRTSSSSGAGSSSSRVSSSSGAVSSSSRASSASGAGSSSSRASSSSIAQSSSSAGSDDGKPIVYMTNKITPEALVAVYEALGLQASGKVAVKLSTGEPANRKYFLNPNLIKNLVQKVNGTIVECNTAYGGQRDNTAVHEQIAKDHGFTAIATVVIMDKNGIDSIPVTVPTSVTKRLKGWDYVGKAFKDYNFHIVLSHFKGHTMGGFGGALKNMSIGYASREGKAWIHTAGRSKTSAFSGGNTQDEFLESMAEAAKAVADANKGKILYINVLNNISIDCDCMSSIAEAKIADIGILASLDPVALDQASLDLVDKAPNNKDLLDRIKSKNGRLTVTHAEKIGLGSTKYNLVEVVVP